MIQSLFEVLNKYQTMFWQAALLTLTLSMATVLISTVLGSLLSLPKISKNRLVSLIPNIYVAFIRGTPLLVQIYMVYYGMSLFNISLPAVTILGTDFDKYFAGLLALVINSTAYVCEIVRSGILSIDDGQMEAARSIGFNKAQSMLYIIFPQAFKNILPALGNEFVSIIKESSQVSVIGLAELMYTTNTIRAISFKSFEPLIIVSVIYFILTYVTSSLLKVMEKRMAKSNRS